MDLVIHHLRLRRIGQSECRYRTPSTTRLQNCICVIQRVSMVRLRVPSRWHFVRLRKAACHSGTNARGTHGRALTCLLSKTALSALIEKHKAGGSDKTFIANHDCCVCIPYTYALHKSVTPFIRPPAPGMDERRQQQCPRDVQQVMILPCVKDPLARDGEVSDCLTQITRRKSTGAKRPFGPAEVSGYTLNPR